MSTSYAIVETGSKQYRVEPQSVIQVEKLEVPSGKKEVALDKVLFYSDGKSVKVGTPLLKGAKVLCECLGEVRGPKVISMKFRRRKGSKRKIGHRQDYTRLRVKKIEAAA